VENVLNSELQLLQALNELSSVQMIVDLLSKEHKHKQDKPTLDIVRNDQWTRVSSNQQKKPKSIGEKSICYTPTTINRFELLPNLTKNANVCRPEKDNELRNYSGCLQRKSVHKENISMGKYKIASKVSNITGTNYNSAINSNHRNQQAHTKDSTHAITVLVNGLTSVDASMKNMCHKPKSSFQQNKENKIIIIGDSHTRGSASNVKYNLNGNYRSSGFVRPGANIDTLTSSVTEVIKLLTNNATIVFWGGTNDVSENNSQDGLKHNKFCENE